MKEAESQDRENPALGDRLSRLNEAALRISENLDLDTVLHRVIDGACSLTRARYGALVAFDDSGSIETLITSGITPEERGRLGDLPKGLGLLQYLNEIEGPLRLADIAGHPRSVGFPENHPPMKTFLGTPIRHWSESLGNIYLTEKEGGREFTLEDEETLVMFASQAAMAITNARRYRDEQRARADLEALVNISPVGVLVFDAKTGDLVSLNQESRRIVRGLRAPGRSQSDILSVLTFQHPDGREIPLAELPTERALKSGETVRAEEILIQLPDGQTVATVINAAPIFSEDGEIVSVVATVQDMTPLEELERLRTEFLGMVSHELRTPLTTIKGSAATVLASSSALDTAETRHLFRIIDEQADHMSHLISDLLDMTRIEVGRLSIAPEPTDLAALVEQARRTFLSGRARNPIEVDLAPDLPRVGVDRQRMLQVLNNLFSNASKYSPDSSAIRVTAVQEDVFVAVSVTDEGRGVSAERLPHLFRKFSRLDSDDLDRRTGGEGLGLAICKGIVEAHGGRIWAESGSQGLGTRFTFRIPVVEEPVNGSAPSAGQLSSDSEVTAPERARILAVDDEPQILRYVKNTLSEAGYIPIVAVDPEEAEHLIEVEEPHLILLDLMLPGTDGFELMQRISAITDAPVIFLSGDDRDEIVVRALEMGADDYIVKPFSPSELAARIEAVLRRQAVYGQPEVHGHHAGVHPGDQRGVGHRGGRGREPGHRQRRADLRPRRHLQDHRHHRGRRRRARGGRDLQRRAEQPGQRRADPTGTGTIDNDDTHQFVHASDAQPVYEGQDVVFKVGKAQRWRTGPSGPEFLQGTVGHRRGDHRGWGLHRRRRAHHRRLPGRLVVHDGDTGEAAPRPPTTPACRQRDLRRRRHGEDLHPHGGNRRRQRRR